MLSLLVHREGLSVILSDPRVSLDNNASERILRGPVIARHTSFGSGGPDGARGGGAGSACSRRCDCWAQSVHLSAGLSRGLCTQPRPAVGTAGPLAAVLMDAERKRELSRPPTGCARHRPESVARNRRRVSPSHPAGSLVRDNRPGLQCRLSIASTGPKRRTYFVDSGLVGV